MYSGTDGRTEMGMVDTAQPRTSWDVIVVGAGSAGAAFATRAAESGREVLLVEAGADYRSADLPKEWRSPNPLNGLESPVLDAFLFPELMSTRTATQDPYLYWRGRGVGGSSTVNGQIAIRPPVDDFADWSAGGLTGWAWDDVLPYFCRLEEDLAFGSAPYHGSAGPTPIFRAPVEDWGPVDRALRSAALGHGFAWAEDVNAPGAQGVSPYPINSRDYERVSTNDAYLEDARSLESLTIRGDVDVDRVLVEGTRAVGIRTATGEVLTAGQIVLSGGVIGSPTILLRSGIGPAADLARLGIDCLADLPVGEQMQDHAMHLVNLPLTPSQSPGPQERHTNCCLRYDSGSDGAANDMMAVSLNQNVLHMASADLRAGAGGLGVWVNRTYSRGKLQLTSTDPLAMPRVEQDMLSDGRDVRRLRDGVRLQVELLKDGAFADICDGDLYRVNPELAQALTGSDQELDSYISSVAADTQHGTSTCAMGLDGETEAVVDSDGRVLGFDSLRVIDASIFPFVPRANTNLVSIMTGEMLADRFLQGA